MTAHNYKPLLAALIVALVLLLPTPAAHADNSKSAHHVMVCVATYHGETARVEMAILDQDFDQQSMRTMLVERVLIPHFAAVYHHEYYDYPNPPQSVHESDLQNVRCRVSHTNAPLEP